MKTLVGVFIIMSFFPFKNAFAGSSEAKFWKWFVKNQDMLFEFEKDRENIFDKLSSEINKVNPNLTFEFSPKLESGKREFVISAAGIKDAFPVVEALYNSAPNLSKWIFIKFRPRRRPLNDVSFGGKSIKASEVHYKMFKDQEKVGLIIFLDGYNDAEKDTYGNIGYLFLDEALGEYDIEMKVGLIEFHSRESEYFEGSRPISELADHFDEYYKNTVH
jgi:hypothetical protein